MKKGFIFDVDGVIADTPHEDAWRDSLRHLFCEGIRWNTIVHKTTYRPEKFTTELYQRILSGKPRIEGARSVLEYFQVPDPDGKMLEEYCDCKQEIFLRKMEQGEFTIFDDALKLILAIKQKGGTLVAASSSKNANRILERISISAFAVRTNTAIGGIDEKTTLLRLFDGNVCGNDVGKGKPDPELFLQAAASVGLPPRDCLVVEDAVSGVQAAKAGKFFCIGIARLNNTSELEDAHADIVTTDLTSVFGTIFE